MKKSGLYTWFGYILPIEEKLKMIKDVGFETICTWWGNDFDETDGDYRTHSELAQKHGLYLEHSHIPYYGCDNLWLDNLDGQEILKMHLEAVRAAGESCVPTLVMHPHDRVQVGGKRFELFSDRLYKIIDACDKYGVRLAVENLSDDEIIRRVQAMVYDIPFVGMCFDAGHNNVVKKGDMSLLDDYSGKLFALHIHDNDTAKDAHLIPYEGNINWKDFLEKVNKSPFEGSLMLECCYPFDFDKYEDDPDYIFEPSDMTALEYLLKAKESCDRIYSEI
ncbi:MAG: sugar phosphate isomerase/epimerase [Eubacteriaceae bacterium]|nr:sugar phosphate isomerase/epimerase [Eubacteriaceae bacterium]